jgi:glyoxylase-like metal-dependent hydrolase (beta-lactamase superfamily II)
MTGDGNHTFLLGDDSGPRVLVDAGVGDPRHLADLRQQLGSASALDVIVTHSHPDHASGAAAIARELPSARFFKWPWADEDRQWPVTWHALVDGEDVACGRELLRVVHTPGHSPDHIALWHEPSGNAFVGDLVLPGGSVMIHTSHGGNLAEYLDSLERLRALSPKRLLPAHGPEVTDPDLVLTTHVRHRRMRERQVIDALASGLDTVQSIADSIYHGLSPALMPAALENVRAHLEKLRHEGRAADDHGRWRTS